MILAVVWILTVLYSPINAAPRTVTIGTFATQQLCREWLATWTASDVDRTHELSGLQCRQYPPPK